MSETTGAPAAPATPAADAPAAPRRGRPPNSSRAAAHAAPAAPTGQLGVISAAPASQPGISVSDAARMLGQQRRAAAPEGAAQAVAQPERKPSANEAARAAQAAPQAAPQAGEGQPATPTPPKAQTGASALERALGVSADGTPAPATEAAPSNESAMEIEGQRYTPAQLREAVLKSADYTQKMQALAERGRQMQEQQQALAVVLPYIQPELQRLAATVQNAPQRPDPALLETDPHGYLRAMAAYEQGREEHERLGSLTVMQQQARERALKEATDAANAQLAAEFPFWADPTERHAAQTEIARWAMEKGGFSREELRELTSPHHLKAMMKAAMFDKMAEGAKSAAPAPRLAAPVRGSPPPAAPTERIQQAQQAFAAKPNWRSGAALLAARRGGNR